MQTQWREIAGYDGDYEVSDQGVVRSRKTGHYRSLKNKHNRFTGYDYVILSGKTHSVHRLVASAFLPNPSGLPFVNHKNEDKTDNRVENLEWCTESYNNEYSKHKRYKPIDLYTPDGEKLCTFTSERAAAELLGVCKAAVCSALKTPNRTCQGFVLKYSKDGE